MRRKYLVLLLIPLVIALAGCGKKKYVAPLPPPPELEVPSNLTVPAISYKQINLSWQDNSTIEDGFRVCCDMGGKQYQTVDTLPANTTSFQHYNLQPIIIYTYYVQACRSDQYASSREVSATTSCPVMITYFNIGRISNHSFAIMGKVQSYADEPCLAEIIVSIYNPDTGDLEGTVKDTFYIGAVNIKGFRIDCSTQHVLFGNYDDYTVEITDVEIEY